MISKEKFEEKLIDIYNFGYDYKDEYGINIDVFTSFVKAVRYNILDRINIVYDLSKYIIIEENYVEPEWKEMISKHYIHSAYYSTLRQRVIRIHFLKEEDFSEKNYLGFITLRPIEEIALSLSFIYINWKQNFFQDGTSYVMTYKKDIHYMGKHITIETYPFFAQDSIVTCCADANVIMLSKYYTNKYKTAFSGKITSCFIKASEKHRLPKKVSSTLLEDILTEMGIPFRTKRFRNVKKYSDKEWDRVQKYIDAYVESGIPVILGIDGHVVQLIGHMEFKEDLEKCYIVYDDSGYLERIRITEGEEIKYRFSYLISIKDIKKYLQRKEDNKGDSFFVLMPEHERVYIDFEKYQIHVLLRISQYANVDTQEKSIYSKLFDSEGNISNKVSFRSMLVDNSCLKNFLTQLKTESQNDCIERLTMKELPHFLWYTEIGINNDRICLFADPTMYYDTRDLEKLFLKEKPIGIIGEKYLSLLTKGE